MLYYYLQNWFGVLAATALLLFLAQCATPGSLTGGEKDETPPQVITEKSTPNEQTNFHPERITLTFDEWVRLKDVGSQVIISPPFQAYEVSLKGKSVVFDFGSKDTLRDNVTYVIQFGNAVQDLTESNPAKDLRFVFSTGPYIDSLAYQGTVVDAYSGEAVEDALVLLYDNLNDTVFQKERPLYFGRTNEKGQFAISNLRAGSYLVRALQDADANYRYNQESEAIAYLPEPLELPVDSLQASTDLRLFQTLVTPQLIEVDSSEAGVLQFTFDPAPDTSLLRLQTRTDTSWLAYEQDTVWLWQRAFKPTPVYLTYDTLLADTFRLPAGPAPTASGIIPLEMRRIPTSFRQGNPLGDYRLGFNRPLVALDTSLARIRFDTLAETVPRWWIDSVDQRQLVVRPSGSWKTNGRYYLTLLPNAVTDIWGRTNADTIREQWSISSRKNLGNLNLTFHTDTPEQHFLIIVRKGENEPVERLRLHGQETYTVAIEALPPGDYQLEIIWDDNANGRWDTGRYTPRQLPEKVIIKALESLRANWDLVLEVDI